MLALFKHALFVWAMSNRGSSEDNGPSVVDHEQSEYTTRRSPKKSRANFLLTPPRVVQVYTGWAGPCTQLVPTFKNVAMSTELFEDRCKFHSVPRSTGRVAELITVQQDCGVASESKADCKTEWRVKQHTCGLLQAAPRSFCPVPSCPLDRTFLEPMWRLSSCVLVCECIRGTFAVHPAPAPKSPHLTF